MASSGLLQAKAGAAEDIKSATGQYNASLGMTSNERSGKAILARQREGDIGTYHYVDNLARAIRHIGRQLVDLIPKIYDTERIARIIGEDGEPSTVKMNPGQQEPVKRIVDQEGVLIEKIYNPGVGKYDVRVITGPGYATKRQEALESMAQLLQGNPQLWQVAGDLFVKNMDWPGAQDLAKRFKKTIDPKVLADEDDPALAAANQQMEAMAAEMENMFQMLQNVNKSMEVRDLEIKEQANQIKAFDAETKRISAVQAGMSEQQIQDIAMGVVAAAMESNDNMVMMNQQREMPEMQPEMQPEMMPLQGEMNEMR
jgi:predicted NBD/HSP70 family sugar kinase